jgi:hypothetical protein
MKTPLIILLFAVMCVAQNATAGDPLISVTIAVPMHKGERQIEYLESNSHFHVIIANTSDKPQRIWREWCSWGYFGLTFEFTDQNGKKWVARKEATAWTRNFPDWWTLEARESLVIDVYFGDLETWKGFPLPEKGLDFRWPENGLQTVTMQAVFEFKRDDDAFDEGQKNGIWMGRVASKADKFTFHYYRIPKKK